eukprot:291091-Prymnesium_polylepis.1
MGPVEPLNRSRPQDAPARILLFPNEPEGFGNPLIDNPAAQEPTSPSPQVLELTAMVDAMELRADEAGVAKLKGMRAASGLALSDTPVGGGGDQPTTAAPQEPRTGIGDGD